MGQFPNLRLRYSADPTLQKMRGCINEAMKADAEAGSASSGLDRLESVITNQNEKLLVDKKTASNDKLSHFAPDFEVWVVSEPNLNLSKPDQLLDVATHATFGRLKAKVLTTCSCTKEPGQKSNNLCSIHAEEVQLSDLIFEITQAVHATFTDDFMCFV